MLAAIRQSHDVVAVPLARNKCPSAFRTTALETQEYAESNTVRDGLVVMICDPFWNGAHQAALPASRCSSAGFTPTMAATISSTAVLLSWNTLAPIAFMDWD